MILSFLKQLLHITPNLFKKEEELVLISLADLKMGRDRAFSSEYTKDIDENLKMLQKAVQNYLTDLGITKRVVVSSGWRPAAINTRAKGAKKSLHMLGLAVDILDDEQQSLASLCMAKADLLKKHNLWLENPRYTKGNNSNWVHLDLGRRLDRPVRIFIP